MLLHFVGWQTQYHDALQIHRFLVLHDLLSVDVVLCVSLELCSLDIALCKHYTGEDACRLRLMDSVAGQRHWKLR